MSVNTPLLSIGLPVYNGEPFIKDTLNSILHQTFKDYELIISDNASTDHTEAICRDYAGRDCRIRYYRNKSNLGATINYNRVFELSQGKYFKWAAADDVLHPEFLAKCIDRLQCDPALVLCYTRTNRIDENGVVLGIYDFHLAVDSPKRYKRFHDVICVSHPCTAVFGVILRNILQKTHLIGDFAGCDRILLGELSLIGPFHEISEPLFFRRDHAKVSGSVWPNQRQLLVWFDPKKAGQMTFPFWRRLLEYFRTVGRVPMGRFVSFMSYLQIGEWALRRWRELSSELKIIPRLIFFRSTVTENLKRMQQCKLG